MAAKLSWSLYLTTSATLEISLAPSFFKGTSLNGNAYLFPCLWPPLLTPFPSSVAPTCPAVFARLPKIQLLPGLWNWVHTTCYRVCETTQILISFSVMQCSPTSADPASEGALSTSWDNPFRLQIFLSFRKIFSVLLYFTGLRVLVTMSKQIYLSICYVVTGSVSNSKTLYWASSLFKLIISSLSGSET